MLPGELSVAGPLRHGGTGYRTTRDRTEGAVRASITDPVSEPPEGQPV
jgi:hypothetical protein